MYSLFKMLIRTSQHFLCFQKMSHYNGIPILSHTTEPKVLIEVLKIEVLNNPIYLNNIC
jgi:hypothetical protein